MLFLDLVEFCRLGHASSSTGSSQATSSPYMCVSVRVTAFRTAIQCPSPGRRSRVMASKNLVEAKLTQLREGQWSEADARFVLAALDRSADSVSAFARTHDLNPKRIYWWRARLSDQCQRDGELEQLSFAPVVVTGLGQRPAVIVRIGELEIEVVEPHKVEPTWLAQLLAAVKGGA